MKLQSTTNFVLEQNIRHNGEYTGVEMTNLLANLYGNIVRHANFLKQPLTLSMFVTCDENGNVLEQIDGQDYDFHKAKECCLFEGCRVEKKGIHYLVMQEDILPVWASWNESKTIEDLIPNNLNLTQTAIKQLNP